MTRIVDLRTAVVQTTKTTLGEGWDVKAHPGTFDIQELLQRRVGQSAVRIAITGGNATNAGDGEIDLETAITAVIIATRDDEGANAAATAELIASHWQDNSFAALGARPFGVTRINNLYSTTINNQGIAMWGVEAQGLLRFGADQITGDEYAIDHIIAEQKTPATLTTTIGLAE
ncbi:MAG: hypothetical protein K0U36_04925 [Alphaproteobacteria bacterium]|nr:hypothetical protein [Alphaproteobacteria bacterium]